MPEFDTAEGWESYFAEKFPDGLLATFGVGEPELAGYTNAPQRLAVRVGVDQFDEENPRLFISDYETGHPMFFTVESIEDKEDGRLIVRVPSGDDGSTERYVLLSTHISENDREMLRARKEGGIFS